VLAGVLATAAIAKLRARAANREQTIALVGARWGAAVAKLLPFVELAIAVALVTWWSPVPGIVALVVLLGFSAVVVRAQLRRLPCPCFGGAGRGAAGPMSLVRNALLGAYAVLATASPAGAHAGATIVLTLVFGALAAVAVALSP
jgi:methylamine utilization protein MauE